VLKVVQTEGCPDQSLARSRLHRGQEGQGARTDDLREVCSLLDGDEIVGELGIVFQKFLEPATAGRDVVDDGVEHEAEVAAQALDVCPRTEVGIDDCIVDDGEAIVGGVGEERQDVDTGDDTLDVLLQHLGQGLQRGFTRLGYLVAIGDEDGVALRQAFLGGWAFLRCGELGVSLSESGEDGA